MGIEPTLSAWKAEVLPLNYTRLVYNTRMLFVTCYVVLKSLLQASYKFGCERLDLNQRPRAYETRALPDCATPR